MEIWGFWKLLTRQNISISMMSQDNYEDFKTEFQNLEFYEIKLWYSAAGLIETATANCSRPYRKC